MTMAPATACAIDGASIQEFRLAGRARIAPHIHGRVQIGLLMAGAYSGDGDEEIEMRGPELVLYPAHTRSGAMFDGPAQHFLWIGVDSELLSRFTDAAALPARTARSRFGPLLQAARRLAPLARRGADVEPIEVEAALMELFERIAGSRAIGSRPRRGWRLNALDCLHAEDGPLSLTEVARALDLHPAHLARAFKAEFGCSMGEYRRRLRLAAAARDLHASTQRIADIAAARGFYDQSHFNRHFRRGFGLSPSAFRMANSGSAARATPRRSAHRRETP